MKWPFVSRTVFDYLTLELQFYRKQFIKEQERADRAIDELQTRVGFAPVSEPVRNEINSAIEEVKKAVQQAGDELDTDMAEVSLTMPEDMG